MLQIIVGIIILAIIAFVLWWFFTPHEASSAAATVSDGRQNAKVLVNGGYEPATLELTADMPATLTFHRKDPSTCLERVVFPDFGINEFLPENADTELTLPALKPGEYDWACGMNMFHGKIIVK